MEVGFLGRFSRFAIYVLDSFVILDSIEVVNKILCEEGEYLCLKILSNN